MEFQLPGIWKNIASLVEEYLSDPMFHIDQEAALAIMANRGVIKRIQHDECESEWIDLGGEG